MNFVNANKLNNSKYICTSKSDDLFVNVYGLADSYLVINNTRYFFISYKGICGALLGITPREITVLHQCSDYLRHK